MDAALRVHIHFCRQRCSCCSFCTWVGLERTIRPYAAALDAELSWLATRMGRRTGADSRATRAGSLYFGGGTRPAFPVDLLAHTLRAAPVARGAEISLEANPGTVDLCRLVALRRAGINGLSLGMQSADADELALLGRVRGLPEVVQAVRWARSAGFDNQNLDLIYGLPRQELGGWIKSLNAALVLGPEHLSLCALSVEPDTPLGGRIGGRELEPPDPDLAADTHETTREKLAAAGYLPYEISSWALPGRECRHNLAYWQGLPYIGAGAGAWGHWPVGQAVWRLRNEPHPQSYIRRWTGPANGIPTDLPASPACVEREHIPRPLAMAETMFMGLRLLGQGVSRRAFEARLGSDPIMVCAYKLCRPAQT